MANRKKIIEELTNNFQVLKNKMYCKMIAQDKGIITNSQWFVLSIIDKNSNVGIKEISSMLSISSSAATQLVNGLVKKGYVVRATDSKDRRELNLALSKKGSKQILAMRKKHLAIAGELFKSLSQKELLQYLKIQAKILSHI